MVGARSAGRRARAAVDLPSARILDRAALGPHIRAGGLLATALVRRAGASTSLRRLAGTAVEHVCAAVGDCCASCTQICATARNARLLATEVGTCASTLQPFRTSPAVDETTATVCEMAAFRAGSLARGRLAPLGCGGVNRGAASLAGRPGIRIFAKRNAIVAEDQGTSASGRRCRYDRDQPQACAQAIPRTRHASTHTRPCASSVQSRRLEPHPEKPRSGSRTA